MKIPSPANRPWVSRVDQGQQLPYASSHSSQDQKVVSLTLKPSLTGTAYTINCLAFPNRIDHFKLAIDVLRPSGSKRVIVDQLVSNQQGGKKAMAIASRTEELQR